MNDVNSRPDCEPDPASKGVIELFGKGRINVRGNSMTYKGTLPTAVRKSMDVYVIGQDVMNEVLETGLVLLLARKVPMEKYFWEIEEDERDALIQSRFPDEILYKIEGEEHKLFLDRHWYTLNPKDMMWCRYVSVDQAIVEGELNGEKNEI